MQTENRLFDDFAKLLNGAAGTLAGMGREAQESARIRAREWVGGLDLVSRDEFEAVKAMAAAARDEADALRARLDALEGRTAAEASVEAPTTEHPSGDRPAATAAAEHASAAHPAATGGSPQVAPVGPT